MSAALREVQEALDLLAGMVERPAARSAWELVPDARRVGLYGDARPALVWRWATSEDGRAGLAVVIVEAGESEDGPAFEVDVWSDVGRYVEGRLCEVTARDGGNPVEGTASLAYGLAYAIAHGWRP